MTISGKARIAGVMGWPVDHSLSPRLHGYWLQHMGIDGAYVPMSVNPDGAEAAIRALGKLGFAGANVTVPHKRTAFDVVDQVDAAAKRLGAVNTIVVDDEGALHGSNTDGFGFLENLRAGHADWSAESGPAVVLGAGGAARAVAAALDDAGAPEVRICNRTRTRADELVGDLGGNLSAHDWDRREDVLTGCRLLVNTTTLGMTGKAPLDMDLENLPADAVVNDIVYAPLETDLLNSARARGNAVVDGLGMLLHQARPGFAAWFGAEPAVTQELRDFVLDGT